MDVPLINLHTHLKSETFGYEILIRNYILGLDNTEAIDDRYFSIGVHPCYIPQSFNSIIFEKLILNKNCIAIGECGLDKNTNNTYLEEPVLIKQIELSIKYNKPLIVHCVGKHQKLANILLDMNYKLPFILHGFNQKPVLLKHFKNLDFYLSFGIAVLQKNSNARFLVESNFNKFFLETDDKNISIQNIYEHVSLIQNKEIEILKTEISKRFFEVFNVSSTCR